MSFDPDDAQRYLWNVDYPTDKETLLPTAQENDAPDELTELIAGMPLGELSEPEEFMNHLRAVPNRDNRPVPKGSLRKGSVLPKHGRL